MIHLILSTLFNFATGLVSKLGYFGIFLGMLIESASIPLPSEAIMGFSGYLVYKGEFNFWLTVFFGALGNATGSTIMYLAGKYGGHPFLERYGKYLRIEHKEIHKAEKWFNKYGDITVFISQLLPVIRTFISFPAGVLEINYKKFIIYTFTGAFIWCAVLVYVGKTLGSNWERISAYLKPVQNVMIGLVILLVLYWLYKEFFAKKKDSRAN